MRLNSYGLGKVALEASLKMLLGKSEIPEPSQGALPFYYQAIRADILEEMPSFDR
jgi:hypothetical protein